MVFARFSDADTFVFQTGKGRQHVDRRRYALFIKFTRQNDLSFGDVSGKVGNGVRLVVFGHRKNWDLRNRAFFPVDSSRAFVKRRKVGVQITGIAAATGHFFSCGGDFAQGFGVVRNIRRDDKHVHALFKRKIFRCGQCHTRRCDTFDRGIVCKVDEKHRAFDCACFSEIGDKEIRFFKCDTDSGENDGEFAVAVQNFRLSCDLRRKFRMGKSRYAEHRQFLSPDKGVKPVDCADARLNEFVGIIARGGVYGLTVYVKSVFGDNGRAAVTGIADTVEDAAEHIFGHRKFHALAQKSCFGR